ncbi:MAG: hypothetical protein IJ497_00740 [Clostridia bacterium]|nr:hypothetical protein [Clostridia bacterium]
MRKPDLSTLPREFVSQYRKNIALRLAGTGILAIAAGVFCFLYDFGDVRNVGGARFMVFLIAYAMSCLIFRLHLIFKPSWMGEIIEIIPKRAKRVKLQASTNLRTRLIVDLIIDRGEEEPFRFELWDEGMEHKGVRTEDGVAESFPENKFLSQAPYKTGDTVIYLRGMKYPMRCGVKTEGMFDVLFVCPYCGEINKAERETCYHCGKVMVK